MVGAVDARGLWRSFETIHAVTYFADESRAAATEVGLKGFWMGYFGFRAAPMGAVGPGVVQATFANFAPVMVERAIPDAWRFAAPPDLLAARSASAAVALRRLAPSVDDVASRVVPVLGAVVAAGDLTGRPLFAANRDLPDPEDPVAALWQCCTALREHRGDGHVAALATAGLSGLDAHLLQVAAGVVPADRLREARGWTQDEWDGARDRLVDAGVLDANSALTAAGAARKARVEDATDVLAAVPWAAAGDDATAVSGELTTVATEIRAAGGVPFPNPIGLPA